MDVARTIGGTPSVPVSEPLLPHSQTQAHRHMKVGAVRMGTGHNMSSESDSGSSSGEGESDVSDMVVDNSSKFAALSKTRRKSGESDYVPHEESRSPESQSESESESNSGQSEESDTSAESRGLPRKPPTGSLVRRLSDESDLSSSSSSRVTPAPLQQHQRASPGMSPLIKRTSNSRSSPFTKTNTRNILNDVAMRRHNYQLCPPKRQAAMNVKYSFYSDDEGEEEDERIVRSSYQSRVNRKRRRSPSGSEYEASDPTSLESSGEDSFVVDDDESDDDYRPRKRGAGGRGRRARVSKWLGCLCRDYYGSINRLFFRRWNYIILVLFSSYILKF